MAQYLPSFPTLSGIKQPNELFSDAVYYQNYTVIKKIAQVDNSVAAN